EEEVKLKGTSRKFLVMPEPWLNHGA
ncbi:hypothetical protein DBR06_SOUSAS13810032, partial [Sousa chinensis]